MMCGSVRAQPKHASGNKSTTVSTRSAASSSRCEPRWPFWPPRLRSALRLLRAALPPRKPEPGPSLEGGRCEFFELRFSSSVNRSTCLVSASTFAVSSALLAVSSALHVGARWSLAGAEAVLKLRSLYASGDFDEYWRFHEQREHERNHKARYPGPIPVVPAPTPRRPSHLRVAK
jgi:hypothetical protein